MCLVTGSCMEGGFFGTGLLWAIGRVLRGVFLSRGGLVMHEDGECLLTGWSGGHTSVLIW